MKIFDTHSVDTILEVIDEVVEWMFRDAEEVGSSDMSAAVRSVCTSLGADFDALEAYEFAALRNAVNASVNDLENR